MLEVRIFNAQWEHLAPSFEMDLGGRQLAVADLLAELGLDAAEVGIVTVDGRQSKPEEVLPGTGRVCIFPPMFGG
jgi:sulfur carrier protein ThiS